jgi:hypothetical protein
MNAKDTVVGTAKQIVAEIVGDGRLAEEGARQAGGRDPLAATTPTTVSFRRKGNQHLQTPRFPKPSRSTTRTGSPGCWDTPR